MSVYLLFDERMGLHNPIGMTNVQPECLYEQDDELLQNEDSCFVAERPARIFAIHNALKQLERRLSPTHQRFLPLPCIPANKETICLVHSPEHYQQMLATSWYSDDKLKTLEVENDLYFCHDTFLAASLACGGVVQCVNAVTDAFRTGVGSTRAIAVVRPPGHHALRDSPMGFCYFNNIAVAAKHAIHTKRARRVFILDWDVHHGNGIQQLTYDDPNIFYLSIHRGNSATTTFYPGTGQHDETGQASGVGTNLNIVWPCGMGNVEYAGAFAELVLPVLSSFNPDLILVASGLDAAKGDLLGDCGLSPELYFIMMESLLETVGGDIPVVVALEGGYNLRVISECMQAVALALLDEPFDETRESSLSQFWSRGELVNGQEGTRRSKRNAIQSIKNSARALAQSRVCPTAPIQMPRPPPVPTTATDFKQRSRRLSLRESDRYPLKKRMLLRASGEICL